MRVPVPWTVVPTTCRQKMLQSLAALVSAGLHPAVLSRAGLQSEAGMGIGQRAGGKFCTSVSSFAAAPGARRESRLSGRAQSGCDAALRSTGPTSCSTHLWLSPGGDGLPRAPYSLPQPTRTQSKASPAPGCGGSGLAC